MNRYKPNFTISEIGKFRFYTGIIIGVGYSIILNFLLQLSTKISNQGTYFDAHSFSNIVNYQFTNYYSILIGQLAVGLGFCFTCYIWMSNPFYKNKKKSRRIRFAQVNTLFVFCVFLLFILRMATFFVGINIYVKEYFGALAFLFPLYIFLYNWMHISKVYQSLKHTFISIIICILLGLILSRIII